MLDAPSIISDAPSILSEWTKMFFTQVDPYDSYGSTLTYMDQVDPYDSYRLSSSVQIIRINRKLVYL